MTQLALDLATHEGVVERFDIGPTGLAPWLAEWRERQRSGWDVHVLLAPDESHAVAVACREARL